MKDFGKMFARRYSAVCVSDEEANANASGHQQHQSMPMPTGSSMCALPEADPAAAASALAALQRAQRRKSLKANRSMKPMDILGSFFNEPNQGKRNRVPTRAFLLLAIGFLAITTAVLVKVFQPYDLIFKWKLIMADKGEIFNLWAQPPVDLYIKIYLFNITNAEAFLAGREQLKVEQVGPYVYKEIMTHENITFNENNTMSTTPSHPLVWQEHMSEGRREDDEVIMLNIAMLAISHLTASHPFFVRMALKTLFVSTQAEPIVRTTAKEFMFGYPSALARLGNTFLPNWISFEKVGLIDRMYDFSTDFETFYTGVPNPALSGLYATYRGETTLPQWEGDHCSNIEYASDGTKFKSFIEPNETVKFFRKSMCRPINLYRVGEQRTFGSLKGYNYVFEDNAFDNGATNEANKCFCRKGDCQPVGLIDVTDCYYGFPISLSFPHFMNGDVGLQQNVTGMNPDPAQHSSAFVIQPESGLPLSLSVKVQINMHFKDLSNFPTVARFSHLTAPMLWFEIMMPSLPDSLDSRFNFYLNILPLVNPLGFWIALIMGVGLLGYAITRATLHMSSYARQAANISEGKYARANLLQNLTGGATNQVYSPCELKLIDNSAGANKQHVIGRSTDEDLAFQERRRKSAYALDMEPALSDAGESSDEGNECDTLTLSRNSTTSSSCIEIEHCNEEDDICIECFDENPLDSELATRTADGAEAKHQLAVSFVSSGFASSPSSIQSSSSHVNFDSSDGKGWVPYAQPHQFGGTSPKHV
ncbi:scavenger receptor class B member 1 isoform X1 [Drosophila pseudoobscura]|uniref:Scavenger receptor class B member 1 isoform X1 n=1 Tax=Drosophila pseudoobscura pseudoobscura TaxID=46245 RepID=B5DK45_DROPS|nr:scavenger receptor class B member 1 isoform X1 [Drosophila pseudoobscura]